jgi:hypothetical protein
MSDLTLGEETVCEDLVARISSGGQEVNQSNQSLLVGYDLISEYPQLTWEGRGNKMRQEVIK